jgi:hypothetical protein
MWINRQNSYATQYGAALKATLTVREIAQEPVAFATGAPGPIVSPALSNYFYANETQASGTHAGGSVAGLNTRILNTVVTNNIGASLTSNQVTLPAGTYWISARAPAEAADRSKLIVYNVTDAAIAINGPVNYAAGPVQITGIAEGYVTIAATKVFELRQYLQTGTGTFGLGIGNSGVIGLSAAETFAEFRAWKVG